MLLPKKAKTFIKPTAEKLGVDEELVEDIVNFYWKEVRKSLSDLKSPRIMVANLGSFNIKHWLLADLVKEYQKRIDSTNPDKMTFQAHAIKKDVEDRLVMVNGMIEVVNSNLDRKKQIKAKRKNDK